MFTQVTWKVNYSLFIYHFKYKFVFVFFCFKKFHFSSIFFFLFLKIFIFLLCFLLLILTISIFDWFYILILYSNDKTINFHKSEERWKRKTNIICNVLEMKFLLLEKWIKYKNRIREKKNGTLSKPLSVEHEIRFWFTMCRWNISVIELESQAFNKIKIRKGKMIK